MLINISIPDHFVKIAKEWAIGTGYLQAVASTGNLTLGTIRPWNEDEHRYMTDQEWHVHLWVCLGGEVDSTRRMAVISGDVEEAESLRQFRNFAEDTSAMLYKSYELPC